jgi:hypothetical protein
MMTIPPTKYPRRRHHRFKPRATTQSPSAALTLIAADFDAGAVPAPTVTLAFDRAIDIAGLDASEITVDDGPGSGSIWQGGAGSATLIDPQTVRLPMSEVGPSGSTETTLTATAASGIRAADDGGTWAGATNVELPFP